MTESPGTRPRPLRPVPLDSEPVGRGDATGRPEPDAAERALVERARAGDADAFRDLVERQQNAVFRLAMRILSCDRSRAEDICQEVFLRVFRGLPRFTCEVSFGAWVHTIALNICRSEIRSVRTLKRGAHRTLSLDAPIGDDDSRHIDPPSHFVDPGDRADQLDFGQQVRRAIAQLPDEFRDAVVLRDVQDLGYDEISAILGVPIGTVRSRIHRGRVQLQRLLEGFAG